MVRLQTAPLLIYRSLRFQSDYIVSSAQGNAGGVKLASGSSLVVKRSGHRGHKAALRCGTGVLSPGVSLLSPTEPS